MKKMKKKKKKKKTNHNHDNQNSIINNYNGQISWAGLHPLSFYEAILIPYSTFPVPPTSSCSPSARPWPSRYYWAPWKAF